MTNMAGGSTTLHGDRLLGYTGRDTGRRVGGPRLAPVIQPGISGRRDMPISSPITPWPADTPTEAGAASRP